MQAAMKGQDECARMLVASGAPLDRRDARGMDAADLAAARGEAALADFLGAAALAREVEQALSEAMAVGGYG